jgi:cell wall-associated NlpC family hydrolase
MKTTKTNIRSATKRPARIVSAVVVSMLIVSGVQTPSANAGPLSKALKAKAKSAGKKLIDAATAPDSTPTTPTTAVPVKVLPVTVPVVEVPVTTAPAVVPPTAPPTAPPTVPATAVPATTVPATTVPATTVSAVVPPAVETVQETDVADSGTEAPVEAASSLPAMASAASVGPTVLYVRLAPYAANVRTCASTNCGIIGGIRSGTPVSMICWQDGPVSVVGNYASPRWFKVNGAGLTGFVHSSFVNHQTNVPNCAATPPQPPAKSAALTWAMAHVGSLAPTAAEKLGNPADRWSGWCALFAYDAHKIGAGSSTVLLGNANQALAGYQARGMVRTGIAPAGALLFWGPTPGNSYGHVAIATADGKAVGTRGFANQYLPVGIYEISAVPNYVGWVNP